MKLIYHSFINLDVMLIKKKFNHKHNRNYSSFFLQEKHEHPKWNEKKDHSKFQSMDKCFARDASLVFNSAQTNWISERSWTYYAFNMLIKASKVADSKMTQKKYSKEDQDFDL